MSDKLSKRLSQIMDAIVRNTDLDQVAIEKIRLALVARNRG